MPVAAMAIEVTLPGAESLKDKRAVIRALKDRLRSRFNVSVAEVDHQELWQRATLGVAAIGPDRAYLAGLMARAGEAAAAVLAGQEFVIGGVEILD
ncbi:MAG: DUF503 domain-containing protein [Terriglobales bacterium]